MKKFKDNKLFVFLAGFLFVTAISSDPLIHEHFDSSDSIVECEYCENKTFDTSDAKTQVNNAFISELTCCELKNDFFSPSFQNFQSRAPPKS